MKKLKLTLESLEITSFDTAPDGQPVRGTLRAHQSIVPTPPSFFQCEPTDADFDCTYGCSHNTDCAQSCVGFTDFDCMPA